MPRTQKKAIILKSAIERFQAAYKHKPIQTTAILSMKIVKPSREGTGSF